MKKWFRYILTFILSLVIIISSITSDLLCVNSYAVAGVDDLALLYEIMIAVGGATAINQGGIKQGVTVNTDDLAEVGYEVMKTMDSSQFDGMLMSNEQFKTLVSAGMLSSAYLYNQFNGTDGNNALNLDDYRNAYNTVGEQVEFPNLYGGNPNDDDDPNNDKEHWWQKKGFKIAGASLATAAATSPYLAQLATSSELFRESSYLGADSAWFEPIFDYYEFGPVRSNNKSSTLIKFDYEFIRDKGNATFETLHRYTSHHEYDSLFNDGISKDYSASYYNCNTILKNNYNFIVPIYIQGGPKQAAWSNNTAFCDVRLVQTAERREYTISPITSYDHYSDNHATTSRGYTSVYYEDYWGLSNVDFNDSKISDFKLNYFSGLCFNSYQDACRFFDDMLLGSVNTDLLMGTVANHKATPEDFVKNNTFENQFKNVNYVTTNDLLNYLNHMSQLSPDVYNDYNSYIQEGSQYISNYYINQTSTDPVNPNPSTSKDYSSMIQDLVSQARIIGNDLVNLPAYCNQMLTQVSALPQQIADAIAEVLPNVFPQYDPEKYPYPYPWPYPDIDPKPVVDPEPVDDPDPVDDSDPETDPDPDPVTDPIKIPQPPYDVYVLNWPDVDLFEWPSEFPWPDLVGEVDLDAIEGSIDTNLRLPDGFNEFKGLYVDPFTVRYSSITYPVFKIDTPDILRPFINKGVIVLYDTSDHKDLFIKVRGIIEFALYFGLVMWLIKAFKNQIEYTGES